MKAIGLIFLGVLLLLPGVFLLVSGFEGFAMKALCFGSLGLGACVGVYGLVLNHRDHTRR